MATKKWEQGSVVEGRLAEQPYSFNFYQAVSLLEEHFDRKMLIGKALSPNDEPVSFKVRPGFSFPASEISELRFIEAESRAEMDINFMGLIGPSGILPHWYNELSMERLRNKDSALVEFLDMFHHRLISLLYLAWKRSRITVHYRRGGTDRFSARFRSMIGLGSDKSALPQGIVVESLLYFAGLISRQSPTVAAIESAVSHFSGQKTVVNQFVERTIKLPESDLTSIGKVNSALGENALCGSLVWDNMSKFCIELGPMTAPDFKRFLPGREMLSSILALVRFIVGIEYEFEICLILKNDQVAPCCLGGLSSGFAPQLGWSTWVKAPEKILKENQRVTFQESDVAALKVA